MRKLFFILMAAGLGLSATAQVTKKQSKKEERRKHINQLIKQEEEGVIAYHKHFAGGIKLTSDGYGGFLEIGRARSIKKALLFQLEITERKHNKEEKASSLLSSSNPYIYGKTNFFYPIKLGAQLQVLLGNKSNKNGVSISGNLGGGLVLGLLRPYELEVLDSTGTSTKFIKYSAADSATFTNPNAIIGGPGLGKGWNGLKVTPGIYIKPAVRFDYGKYNEMISAIEVGLIAEFYSKKMPQMVYSKEQQFFFSAYVSLVFGKRK